MGRKTQEIISSPHKLVRHTHFVANSALSLNTYNRSDYWRCTFTKELGATESYLVVEGHMSGIGWYNYPVIGHYITLDHWGIGGDAGSSDARAFGGFSACGPAGNSNNEQLVVPILKVFKADDLSPDPHPNMVGTFPSSQLGAGVRSLDIGCGASSAIKLCHQLLENASSFSDGRRHTTGAYLSIMEFAY